MDDSLFDLNSPENNNERRVYNLNWNQHLQTFTETNLLENTPAFAIDLLHQLELPEDYTEDKILEYEGDLEYRYNCISPEFSLQKYIVFLVLVILKKKESVGMLWVL